MPKESNQVDASPSQTQNSEEDLNTTDGCGWSTNSKEPKRNLLVQGLDMNAEEYDMTHKERGIALILNHYIFPAENREGTEFDVIELSNQFKSLGFEVRVRDNLNKDQILSVLNDLSKEDHTNSDCLVVTVLSHGILGKLTASDGLNYEVEQLWKPFYADVCPSLATKPKLFFIQACQGKGADDGVRIVNMSKTMTDGSLSTPVKRHIVSYTLPKCADILVVNSTVKGFYSWRDEDKGSWFMQTLCRALEHHSKDYDILKILTIVNKNVAVKYQSNAPGVEREHKKKQMPSYLSTLTRTLYFKPK